MTPSLLLSLAASLLLPGFPAIQQTTDYTCGPVSALMVLQFYGDHSETETSLAEKMHSHVDGTLPDAPVGSARRFTDYGTNVCEMHDYFEARPDFQVVDWSGQGLAPELTPAGDSLHVDPEFLPPHVLGNHPPRFRSYAAASRFFADHLRAGRPILVCWAAWGGHWGVVIGLDDNDTPDNAEDDYLVLADPYDTFDRQADSRVAVPLALFFHDWYCAMTPKPFQLQPFVVVQPTPSSTL